MESREETKRGRERERRDYPRQPPPNTASAL